MPAFKCWRWGASHLKGVGWGCSGDKAPGTCCAPGSDQQHYLAGASLVLLSQQATSGPEHPVSDGVSVEKVAFVEFLLLFLASFPNPFPRWKLAISGFYCILMLFPSSICWFPSPTGLEDQAVPLTLSTGCGRLLQQPGLGTAARAPEICSLPAQHHYPNALPTITTGINLHQPDDP